MTASDASSRQSALDRLTANAPFLARLAELNPDDVTPFLAHGTDAPLADVAPPPPRADILRTRPPCPGRLALLRQRGDPSGDDRLAPPQRLLCARAQPPILDAPPAPPGH